MTSKDWRDIVCLTDFAIGYIDDQEMIDIFTHCSQHYNRPIKIEFRHPGRLMPESRALIPLLTHLTSLKLGSFLNKGPEADLSSYITALSHLQDLECIRLSEEAYQKLPNLTSLSTGYFYPVNYPKLRALTIIDNRTPLSLDHVSQWRYTTLTALTLNGVPPPLSLALATQLTDLKYLSVEGSKVDYSSRYAFTLDLKHLTRLEYLNVDMILTDFPPGNLTALTIKEAFSHLGNKFNDATNLRVLALPQQRVTGMDLDFRKFPNLESLHVLTIHNNMVGQLHAEKLTKMVIENSSYITNMTRLTSLRDLTMKNSLDDETWHVFSALTNLTRLHVDNFPSMAHKEITLAHLDQLRELELVQSGRAKINVAALTRLTGLRVAEFYELPYLEVPSSLQNLTMVSGTVEAWSDRTRIIIGAENLTLLWADHHLVDSWLDSTRSWSTNITSLMLV